MSNNSNKARNRNCILPLVQFRERCHKCKVARSVSLKGSVNVFCQSFSYLLHRAYLFIYNLGLLTAVVIYYSAKSGSLCKLGLYIRIMIRCKSQFAQYTEWPNMFRISGQGYIFYIFPYWEGLNCLIFFLYLYIIIYKDPRSTTQCRKTKHWPILLKLWRSSFKFFKDSPNRKPATACNPYIWLVMLQMNYVITNSVKTVWLSSFNKSFIISPYQLNVRV